MTRPRTRFSIHVTADDIDRAHRNNSYRCVVAQAIARSIPDANNIDVDTQTLRFTLDGRRLWYLTPYAVQGYIIAFDAGDPIEPFEFRIQNPQQSRRDLRGTPEQAAKENERARQHRAKKRQQEQPPSGVSDAASTLAAYGASKSRSDGGVGKAPPRVFRTKRRVYGHRVLRVNQQ